MICNRKTAHFFSEHLNNGHKVWWRKNYGWNKVHLRSKVLVCVANCWETLGYMVDIERKFNLCTVRCGWDLINLTVQMQFMYTHSKCCQTCTPSKCCQTCTPTKHYQTWIPTEHYQTWIPTKHYQKCIQKKNNIINYLHKLNTVLLLHTINSINMHTQ